MTSPENLDRLTSWLKWHNMKWSLMISNVQDRIDQEKISSQVNSPSLESVIDSSFLSYLMDWKSFQSEATILGWLKHVIENFYEYCETEIIGQTFEGRNMTIMKVGIIISYSTTSVSRFSGRSARAAAAESPPCGSTVASTPGSSWPLPSTPGCSMSS